MKEKRDYSRDIAEIRSMMERSSKFLSLSGWAGIMAGIYALAGAWIAFSVYQFNPDNIVFSTTTSGGTFPYLPEVITTAVITLILAVGTAVFLSYRKGNKRGEKVWNATSRRLLGSMIVPLLTGGILILILISKGLIGLIAPLTLLFYGLALFGAGKYTYNDVKYLGVIQIGLGLLSTWFIQYSIFLWAIGFGLVHIVYGIYMHFRYER